MLYFTFCASLYFASLYFASLLLYLLPPLFRYYFATGKEHLPLTFYTPLLLFTFTRPPYQSHPIFQFLSGQRVVGRKILQRPHRLLISYQLPTTLLPFPLFNHHLSSGIIALRRHPFVFISSVVEAQYPRRSEQASKPQCRPSRFTVLPATRQRRQLKVARPEPVVPSARR